MAYETGVANGYRDFYRKLVIFLTENSELVAAGDQWEITRGFMNKEIEYLEGVEYVSADMGWEISVAMGWDDTYSSHVEKDGEEKRGWVVRTVDAPNYLGFKSTTIVAPVHYIITARNWLGTTDEADRAPKDWNVEYSDDGNAWNISDTVTGQTLWDPKEARQFTISTGSAHRFWRLHLLDNNGDADYISIGRLRFYDSGSNWISRGYTSEYLFKNNGFAGTDNAYCGMRLRRHQNDYYNIEWMGSCCYDPDLGWETQPHMQKDRFSPLWEFDMQYWFVANGHRMICVMHVDERWVAAIMGKFLPYGAVGEYPYTMMIGGSRGVPVSWSQVNYASHLQMPQDTYGSTPSLSVFHPNNQSWVNLENRDRYGGISGKNVNTLSPTVSGGMGVGNRQLPNSAYVLAPYIIEIGTRAYGQLDGVRWVTGDNQKSGDILDVCGQDWLVFHNQHYTGISDFAALELK